MTYSNAMHQQTVHQPGLMAPADGPEKLIQIEAQQAMAGFILVEETKYGGRLIEHRINDVRFVRDGFVHIDINQSMSTLILPVHDPLFIIDRE